MESHAFLAQPATTSSTESTTSASCSTITKVVNGERTTVTKKIVQLPDGSVQESETNDEDPDCQLPSASGASSEQPSTVEPPPAPITRAAADTAPSPITRAARSAPVAPEPAPAPVSSSGSHTIGSLNDRLRKV